MSHKPKCCLCGLSTEDPLNLGDMKTCKGYNAHYYCLLLASTIHQSGEDEEGILGFLPSDICEELKRSKARTCTYCKKRGASVLCNAKSCKVMFHLPCGIQNDSGHQFYGRFLSNCVTHRPKQKFSKPKEPQACPICYDTIDLNIWTQVLWAPCCKKKSYFHKHCLQQMALSAGYFFKCPICNNSEVFQKTMKHFGVFIPDRDASWELVPNAFQELLYRHEECNAETCQCSRGRKYSNLGPWTIILCSTCGSQGTHLSCNKLKKGQIWNCEDCLTKPVDPAAAGAVVAVPAMSNGIVSAMRVVDINRPSTSRDNESPSTSVSTPSSSTRKRKRGSVETPEKVETKTNTSSTTPEPESAMIEIDSDSDVVVIEEEEPAYKCLVAQDGKVLPVRSICPQENKFSVQGDLNIKEAPKTIDGLMNIVISDVRSLNEPPPALKTPQVDNKKLPVHNRTRQICNQAVNNYVVYSPAATNENKTPKSAVSVIDNQGRVYILKEIMGYPVFSNNGVQDQNNQNAGNYNNNSQENEIVVID